MIYLPTWWLPSSLLLVIHHLLDQEYSLWLIGQGKPSLSLVTFSVFTHPVNTEKKLCEHILTAARVIQEYLTTATIVEVPK